MFQLVTSLEIEFSASLS